MEQAKVIFGIETFRSLKPRLFVIDSESTGIIAKLFKFMVKNEINPGIGIQEINRLINSGIYGYSDYFTLENAEKIRTWLLEEGATET